MWGIVPAVGSADAFEAFRDRQCRTWNMLLNVTAGFKEFDNAGHVNSAASDRANLPFHLHRRPQRESAPIERFSLRVRRGEMKRFCRRPVWSVARAVRRGAPSTGYR